MTNQLGQRSAQKPAPLPDDQLPAFATSLVISIATEARSFSDLGGGSKWSQGDERPKPPANFPTALREKFFQVGGSILLRPQSPSRSRPPS